MVLRRPETLLSNTSIYCHPISIHAILLLSVQADAVPFVPVCVTANAAFDGKMVRVAHTGKWLLGLGIWATFQYSLANWRHCARLPNAQASSNAVAQGIDDVACRAAASYLNRTRVSCAERAGD